MKARLILGLACVLFAGVFPGRTDDQPRLEGAFLLATKGGVEISRSGAHVWDPAQTNLMLQLGDQLRTAESSRATLRLRDATIVNVGELTTLRVEAEPGRSVIDLLRGVLSFFHRDRPGDVEVRGAGASGIVRGTEFVVSVTGEDGFKLALMEGLVEVTNAWGRTSAGTGDFVVAAPNQPPRKAPSLVGANAEAIQWVLYYPAVLDPDEVTLEPARAARWQPVLDLYRTGDLGSALTAARLLGEPTTDGERVLHAGLQLSAGEVAAMERLVARLGVGSPEARLGEALRAVVRAVRFEASASQVTNLAAGSQRTTEWLARAYVLQSQGHLAEALEAARHAAAQSPRFGFAHARVAELEFGSGHVGLARQALQSALALSPKQAAAVALDGFLLAAHNQYAEASVRFTEAIALEPALGDAWLGRGLVRIRQGDRPGGRMDLETAAATEPQRSVLRSYLGKAFAEAGDDPRAFTELARAQQLDRQDPTSWLYSALLHHRRYELAEAIRDLETSVAKNGNRAVYRSQLLLDQDAAVRSANLAEIYETAEMPDVARRESARAVASDYANYSAHLNLASSFNALRDPTRFNLRDETVWFNEHLLASLLAPTDAAQLSQNLSQNEYSRLFARNRVGLSSTTEYFSSGELRQLAAQSGNFDRVSYALDLDYGSKPGLRPNEDLSRIEWYSRVKMQLTPADSVLLLTKYEDYRSGDNFQYADPAQARPAFRFEEQQTPLALAGYHHEWGPGSHTLLLGGRLENAQQFGDRSADQIVAFAFPPADPQAAPLDVAYRNRFEIYTFEASHIQQGEHHTTVVGGRYQTGRFQATADLDPAPLGANAGLFGPNQVTSGDGDLERRSAYLYQTWELFPEFRLTGGFSFDSLTSPRNFRRPPLESGEISRERLSPKLALIYNPSSAVTLRAMYAQSLGGVSYDESIRLEPTQLAGFPQTFRTLISESLAGSVEVPRHDVAALGFDLKLPTRTYLSAEGIFLRSAVDRRTGAFEFDALRVPVVLPGGTDESLRYEERGVRLTVNQILGAEWFLQGRYQFTHAELDRLLPTVPATTAFDRRQSDTGDLHSGVASLLYQRTDGWFGRMTVNLMHQDRGGSGGPQAADLAQLDLFAGWRFPRHRGDLTVGVLNLSDADCHVSPITAYAEFPRERMFYLRLRLNL